MTHAPVMPVEAPATLEWPENVKAEVAEAVSHYPVKRSAVLPLLWIAQRTWGWVPPAALRLVARTLELNEPEVFGVATFYTMFHREPVGKKVLMMCTNVSCMLTGAYETLRKLEQRLGIKAGQTSADGEFTLIEEECLAACADGPAMICGDRYFLRLTADKVDSTLDECRKLPAQHGHHPHSDKKH